MGLNYVAIEDGQTGGGSTYLASYQQAPTGGRCYLSVEPPPISVHSKNLQASKVGDSPKIVSQRLISLCFHLAGWDALRAPTQLKPLAASRGLNDGVELSPVLV